ncbi:MAG: response regulator [Terriglobales bacterium]
MAFPITSTRPGRIFVLDDQQSIADSIAEILKLSGYEAHARYTSGDILDLAAELTPDLLIADVALDPNSINGIDLAIYFERFYPQCRVILISGDPNSIDLNKKARRAGHDFLLLAKPVAPMKLLEAVADSLGDQDRAA